NPWVATQGWSREFGAAGARGTTTPVKYSAFAQDSLPLEEPAYFKTEDVDSEHMTYGQLRTYITQLRTSGFDAVPQMVALQRKVGRYRCNATFLSHTRPDVPGFVFVVSIVKITLRTSSSAGFHVLVAPTGVRSSKNTVRSCSNVST